LFTGIEVYFDGIRRIAPGVMAKADRAKGLPVTPDEGVGNLQSGFYFLGSDKLGDVAHPIPQVGGRWGSGKIGRVRFS
jgi:hypothetical protein